MPKSARAAVSRARSRGADCRVIPGLNALHAVRRLGVSLLTAPGNGSAFRVCAGYVLCGARVSAGFVIVTSVTTVTDVTDESPIGQL